MLSLDTPSVTVFLPGTLPSGAPDADRPVIFLRGEHDVSTVTNLSRTIARVIAAHDSDLVLDLSEVQFMDAATVSVIVRTRATLQGRSHHLVLRALSPSARRVLDLCGFDEALASTPLSEDAPAATADALATWVEVPAIEHSPEDLPHPPVEDVTIHARPLPPATEVGATEGA